MFLPSINIVSPSLISDDLAYAVADWLSIHLPWWGYGLAVILLIFVLVWRFAPEILKQIFEVLAGVAKLLGSFLFSFGKLLFQLADAAWQVWGLLFALRWRLQFAVRFFFATTAFGVLVLGTIWLCAELGMTLINGFKHELPDAYLWVTQSFRLNFPSIYQHLGGFQLPRIREIPFKFDIALFVLALLMFRHHLIEFFASLRREAVPPALEELFLEFDKFRDNPNPGSKEKKDFLEVLLRKIKRVLDPRNKRDVSFAIFEEEEITDSGGIKRRTGDLAISFLPKDSPLEQSVRIPIGKGGAGKAFQDKVAIYIPSVRHRIGIDLDNERSVGLTYFATKNLKYKAGSILSVPVLVDSKRRAIAVVAASSKKRKAFEDVDFEVVRLMASIISTLY